MWLFKRANQIKRINEKRREITLKDYDDTYIFAIRIMKVLGIRLVKKDRPVIKMLRNALYWFEFTNIFLAIMLDFIYIKDLVNGRHESSLLPAMIPCIGYLCLGMLKSYKVVYRRPVFNNLVEELRSMWPQGELTEEVHSTLTKALKELSMLVKAYYYSNIALTLSILVPPYIDMARRAIGHYIPRILPYTYWTPYDSTQPGWFELTVVAQSLQTLLTLAFVLTGDLLFCTFIGHITIQFDLLCLRIRKLCYDHIEHSENPVGVFNESLPETDKEFVQSINEDERNNEHQKELTEIIIRHNALIRLSNDVEEMYSFSLLVNFFYSSIIICFCGFCSVLVEKWNEFMYKTFLLCALLQTWLLCWYGQKLLESSEKVADALYSCGWYTASSRIKNTILIMIHRSQKSVNITTYGFSIVSLVSYSMIIKSAWSYFTLLLNVYK